MAENAMKTENKPLHDKTNKMTCAPSEDSDQPGHPPSLIRVFAVRMQKAWVPSYPLSAQRRLRSDWSDTQADLSLRWAHSHFVGFVMRRLKYGHSKGGQAKRAAPSSLGLTLWPPSCSGKISFHKSTYIKIW